MLLRMYEQMYLIRVFENTLEDLFKKGALFGTIHSCAGQEAVAVGIANALRKDDLVTGHHRSHGHYIALTDDVHGLMAEIMGKACGIVGGRGGSQHLHRDGFYSNGVQGSMVPVATGMAMAEKIKGTENIVTCFIGDGTLGQGIVLENNYYAMSTHVDASVAGSMVKRGEAFGIESNEITTNDVEAIHDQAVKIVGQVRKRSHPHFWVINTYRLSGHSKSDDRSYRTREEEAEWKKRDPLLIAGEKIPKDEKKLIEEKCQRRIKETAEQLENAAPPSKESLSYGLYNGY
jgi:TPP-dependent pyruvate/acetoin dehydrogenase alpha subunit